VCGRSFRKKFSRAMHPPTPSRRPHWIGTSSGLPVN
jgi:hypothetical protein